MKKIEIVIAFVFLFILGCVDRSDILYNTTGTDRSVLYTMEGMPIGDGPDQTNISQFIKDFCDDSGKCIAFVCKNESRGWLLDLLPWTENTLKGGQCWVLRGYHSEDFSGSSGNIVISESDTLEFKINEKGAQYDFFRIGTGSSFLEGIYGDYYTNYSNTMSQKWLMSDKDNSIYPYPRRERLECMLEKGQIPMIVIPKGEARLEYMTDTYLHLAPPGTKARWDEIEKMINYSLKNEAGEIIGPIILVIEQGAELDDAVSVKLEASYIKTNYPEILVAVDPPKENRTEFLNIIFNDTGSVCSSPSGEVPSTYFCVDMIAEDIIFNDFDTCNGYHVLVKVFERGLLNIRNYSKPSIIFTFGGKTGYNYDGSCYWFDTDLTNTYELLMREIPFLTHAGYLSVQSCSPVTETLRSNVNPLCNTEDFVLNKIGEDRPFKVWTVNTWGYINTGSHSPLIFADNGGYSSGCLGLVNLKWASPDQFLELTTERNPSDINYSFYDELYTDLTNIGDNIFNYAEYTNKGECYVCNIHTATSGFVDYVSTPYSISREDCSLFDYGAPYGYEGTITTAGYADKYDLDIFLVRSLAKVDGYDNLDNKTYNFYKSYMKSYDLSKIYSNKFSDITYAKEWQIIGLAVYDYFEDGDAEDFIRSYSGTIDIRYELINNHHYGHKSKDFLKWYQSYIRDGDCNWYYENMCFNDDYPKVN